MANINKLFILLVEDNEADAGLIRIYLKEARIKHQLQHVETLYEAQDAAEAKKPDLVLLDLNLPDSMGFRTLSSFMENHGDLPVIVLTGTADEILGNQIVKAGAQDYLVKGEFDSKWLGRAIRYSLQRHKTQIKLQTMASRLTKSEKRYIETQEMANFGNFEMDLVTNEMVWTDEVYRILGFMPGSINPALSDYLSYVHYEDRDKVEDFFHTAQDGNGHRLEHRLLINGRKVTHVLINAKVYFDETTEKIVLVGGIQDITERKVAEQLLIEKNLSTQTSKIKEDILEDMSFNIRTPMSSIIQLSHLLSSSSMGRQESELMKGLQASVGDLSVAVNNLMNFSMLVSEKVNIEEKELQLSGFVESIRQLVKIKASNKSIQLGFAYNPKIPDTFKADGNKLSQILYNIIENAIKYTPKGGRVEVFFDWQPSGEGKPFLLNVSVEDNGPGISENKAKELLNSEDLLQLDYSVEEKRPLGIAIANKLLRSMEGEMGIKSELGKGATFSIQLPVKPVRQETFQIGDAPSSNLKILLVEDHFLNQISTRRVLTAWSDFVTVDVAENGLVGVDKFRAHGYDLILMDIQMPVMDGFEATSKIREHSNVPIIALTANTNRQEAEKSIRMGMNDYLPKPFKPDDLYVKIMTVMSKGNGTGMMG